MSGGGGGAWRLSGRAGLGLLPTICGCRRVYSACCPPTPAASSGWHTHAADYAVEGLEPDCLYRVQRDGRSIAFASLAADGHLLCAAGAGDRLALVACGGSGWAAAGAAWEQRKGQLYSSRWPDKASSA